MDDFKLAEKALLIRKVEERLLALFSLGELNGTVHTCIGQEVSALAFADHLRDTDRVCSNHRGHGHFLALNGDVKGLIAEIMGKSSGVCGGIGGSQHLCTQNFYSNGIQGGMVPVALGMALANKLEKSSDIVTVFIGDGTLGEGVVYESFNIASKWELPILFVCENNRYAQSTPIELNFAGSMAKRAQAFDIKVHQSNTSDVKQLMKTAKESVEYVREHSKPLFHIVDTYRLSSHSKGDDHRDEREVSSFKQEDFLYRFSKKHPKEYDSFANRIDMHIDGVLNEIYSEKEMEFSEYFVQSKKLQKSSWRELQSIDKRIVTLINEFFDEKMEDDEKILFIGEDVLSPYGGAFKVAANLSNRFPSQVFTTPISEGAITGIGNGLALKGFKPYVEIMFGDFTTLILDQIINHASKFFDMYNKKVSVPLVVRTPMGGKRGYGPTHSQSLERLFLGHSNISVVVLNSLLDPKQIYEEVYKQTQPVIVIENKSLYGKKVAKNRSDFFDYKYLQEGYPVCKVSPKNASADITIVTYGEVCDEVLEILESLFFELEVIAEVIVLSDISSPNYDLIAESLHTTKKLLVVEEGSEICGLGSEIIAKLNNRVSYKFISKNIGSLNVSIPSLRKIESEVIPQSSRIYNEIKGMTNAAS